MVHSADTSELRIRPVTPSLLADLERFSASHGKFRWCSCMRWRMPSAGFKDSSKQDRIDTLVGMVADRTPVGVLAFVEDEPVGWCSIAPRETYRALERSRVLPRLDERPAWSVVCFFIDRHHRRGGTMAALLHGAVSYAHEQGAEVVEGYPPDDESTSYRWMGSRSVYLDAGFVDVTPAERSRAVMRWTAG